MYCSVCCLSVVWFNHSTANMTRPLDFTLQFLANLYDYYIFVTTKPIFSYERLITKIQSHIATHPNTI